MNFEFWLILSRQLSIDGIHNPHSCPIVNDDDVVVIVFDWCTISDLFRRLAKKGPGCAFSHFDEFILSSKFNILCQYQNTFRLNGVKAVIIELNTRLNIEIPRYEITACLHFVVVFLELPDSVSLQRTERKSKFFREPAKYTSQINICWSP